MLVQPQRDKAAALRLLRKRLRRQSFVPTNSIRYTAIQSCRRLLMKKPARRRTASLLPILQSKTWSG